jgi:hypothetical protein
MNNYSKNTPEAAACRYKTLQQLNYTAAKNGWVNLMFYIPSIKDTTALNAELRLKIVRSEVLSYGITTTH